MNLFKTTYNYTISNKKLEYLKNKSNSDLSKIMLPINIGKAGNLRIKTSISWVEMENDSIKLEIKSNVEKLSIGIIIGIIFTTLFVSFIYSLITALLLLLLVLLPIGILSISMTKSKVKDQTIDYLKKI